MKDAGQILSEVLSERKTANPSYSLRAFARDIGLSAPQLSNVMNGHRGLSPAMAEKVTHKLSLDPREALWFKESLRAKFSPSKTRKTEAQKKLKAFEKDASAKYLDLDLFRAVSHWHHFALIELIKISKRTQNQTDEFADRLGISENEVKLALERLERLELVHKSKQGWSVNQDTVIADQGIPTEAVRNFHRQFMEKAIQALAFQSKVERYGYSAMLPVRVKSLERAKDLIQRFKTDFVQEISDTEGGQEIYGLSLQYFKITQTPQEK